uniref:DegT/DnrJ/EryC1/StrS aminotransferase family protein n=1 Tax=viral metagenome TaxID=1070528 RepID=A0A6C0BN50_9ZZZZ
MPGVQEIPCIHLDRERKVLQLDPHHALDRVLSTNAFIGAGTELEAEIEEFLGTNFKCVAVGNGTDALEIVYRLSKLRRSSSSVIYVPAFTFEATSGAAKALGLTVKYMDISPVDGEYIITPETVQAALGGESATNVVAIVGVSLYGQVPDWEGIRKVLPDDVLLIEDGAQSFGSARSLQGGVVDYAITSFYPSKNLGCYGDGGAVFCPETEVKKVRALANHGRGSRTITWGKNSRLDRFQAEILRQKLAGFNRTRASKADTVHYYEQNLRALNPWFTLPLHSQDSCFSVYTIQVKGEQRHLLQHFLATHGVQTRIYYEKPLCSTFPNAEMKSKQVLAIPCFAFITNPERQRIVALLQSFFL